MDKKFLSAEEAIAQFGLDAAEFQRLVDEGELRALADRGTWKYRRDEVEELIRDGVLKVKNPAGETSEQAGEVLRFGSLKTPAEELSFLELDEEALSEGATVVKKSSELSDDTTPSEVFLVDDQPETSSSPERSSPADSVSDVTLVAEPADEFGAGIPSGASGKSSVVSDSDDMPVAGSLSELDIVMTSESSKSEKSSIIVGADELGSDSDVKVVSDVPAEGGVVLAGRSDSEQSAEDSGIVASDSDVKIADSGISLERSDSGITLGRGDSGIALERSDSGISLAGDSGIQLESSSIVSAGDSAFVKEDSGISLGPGDSGLTLEAMADSGISLEAHDSGIQLDEKTGRPRRPARPPATEVEMDEMGSREFTVPSLSDSSADQTTTLVTEEDQSGSVEAPPAKKDGKGPGLSSVIAVGQEVEDLEIADDLEAAELEVEEEEEPAEVLEASDEVFTTEESGELSGVLSGESGEALSAPSAVRASRLEPSWGIAALIPIVACAVLLALNGLILWEGVATMWTGRPLTFSGALVEPLSGLL
jgi:hypothetical protein